MALLALLTRPQAAGTLRLMLEILVTNDDGIESAGLLALTRTLERLGRVWVVAPDGERSASSRSITLDRPLRVQKRRERMFAVNGTPADCVLLACRSLLPVLPDVVASGINLGFNIGEDLDYSGTVGAAAEGAQQGTRLSLAVSTAGDSSEQHLLRVAEQTAAITARLLESQPPERCYVNVNFPGTNWTGLRWTRQGNPLPRGTVILGTDPRGKKYYWIAERPDEENPPEDTDRGAIRRNLVSLSLLNLQRDYVGQWPRPEF